MDLQSRGGGQAVGSDAKHDLVENDSLAPQVVFEPQELQEIQDAGHFETAALHLTSEQATSPEDKGCARDATKTEASTENSKDRAEEAPRSRPGTSSTKEDKKGSGVSTRTIEVQTDPIDDLDRYCIDVSTSTETSPRNTPKDSQRRAEHEVTDSIADIAQLLREAKRINMTLSSTRPTRADPPPAPSTSSIDFELEQLLKELRECRDEGPKSSADPAITLGDGSTASGTPAARDDGDEEYEAVQRAAMEVLERGRRQARLEELEDRIRELEEQKRAIEALRQQHVRLAQAGVKAKVHGGGSVASRRVLTAASAYLAPLDGNKKLARPPPRAVGHRHGSGEAVPHSTARPRPDDSPAVTSSRGASPAMTGSRGASPASVGAERRESVSRTPSYMRPTRSASIKDANKGAAGDRGGGGGLGGSWR